MIKKLLCAFAVLWFGMGLAFGQANITIGSPPFTGTSIGNGITPPSTLFAAGSTPLSVTYPFTVSTWVKGDSTTGLGTFMNIFATGSFGTNGYSMSTLAAGQDGRDTYTLQDLVSPSASGNNGCQNGHSLLNPIRLCANVGYITDGNWHHLCSVHPAAGALSTLYIDAVVRAQGNTGTGVATSSAFWTFMSPPAGASVREPAIWSRALTPAECAAIANRGFAGFSLISGNAPASLSVGLVGYWPVSTAAACTGSGATFNCPDLSGNSNPITLGQAPPTCTISTPPAGPTVGTVSLTGTASDAIGIAGVAWSLTDGTNTLTLSGTLTTAPYTQSFDTTQLIDGTYTLQMTCTNDGRAAVTTTRSLTLGNAVTAKNYFFSPTGNDSNNCTTSGTPCLTQTKFNSITYHGGDTISFDNGNGAFAATTGNWHLCGAGAATVDSTPPNNSLFPGLTGCTPNVLSGVKQLVVKSYGSGGTCTALSASTGCAPLVQGNSGATNLFQAFCVQNVTISGLFLTSGTILVSPFPNNNTVGITVGNASGGSCALPAHNIVVQNNYLINFGGLEIYGINYGGGATAGFTITQNTVTASTTTTPMFYGILVNYGGTSSTVSSNSVSNIAGVPGTQGSGVGIEVSNNSGSIGSNLITENLLFHNMYSSNTCGGGDAIETFQATNVTVQNNEIYNNGQLSTTFGCDNGAVDFDDGTTNMVAQYNYTHGNWGYSFQTFNFSNTNTATVRFNIAENDQRGGVANAALSLAFQTNLTSSFFWAYNNTIYVDSTGASASSAFEGVGLACAATGSIIANNIFMVGANPVNGRHYMVVLPASNNGFCNTPGQVVAFQNNDYFPVGGGSPYFQNIGAVNVPCTTLVCWQSSGIFGDAAATTANPGFSGLPAGTICGSTSGPSPSCPTNYELSCPASAMCGAAYTGLTSAPYNQVIPTTDYFGNACSGNVRNIGADACR